MRKTGEQQSNLYIYNMIKYNDMIMYVVITLYDHI